jgi:ribosome-binding ATPase YchF (GTP1/OBG family)
LPKNIQVVDSITDNNGNQVNAVYHRDTDTIELNSSAIAGQRVYRVVNIILHESLHRQLYTKYNTEQALALVKPIYDKFKFWLDTQDNSTKERLKPYLFENFNTSEALEEFLVESITSNALMSALNEIKYDNRKTNKRKTLFSRLLEVIADMLGIKINEDSLLAAARDAYKAIKKMPKESNQEAIQGTFQFEEEIVNTEQIENPNEDNSQDYNYNNDNLNDGLDMFSSVDDNTVVNMAELTSRLPIDQQSEFATLLDTGRISFSCM